MSKIHITREHALGLPAARQLAVRWAESARQHLHLECRYEQGDALDVLHFERAGAHGRLEVSADRFALDARLGLLLGVFRHRIQAEIEKNLDLLLAHEEPLSAFDQAVARHTARKAAAGRGQA